MTIELCALLMQLRIAHLRNDVNSKKTVDKDVSFAIISPPSG